MNRAQKIVLWISGIIISLLFAFISLEAPGLLKIYNIFWFIISISIITLLLLYTLKSPEYSGKELRYLSIMIFIFSCLVLFCKTLIVLR